MPDRGRYYRQIAAARDVGLAMTAQQLDEFIRILEQYADELAARVALGLHGRGHQHALSIAREILRSLTLELAESTREGIVVTAQRVAEIHAQATVALADGVIVGGVLSRVGGRAAQAVLARPHLSRSFRTIRKESIEAVDRILKRGLLRGSSVDVLSRELRLHVLGSDALPERLLLDRRRIGYAAIRELGYDPTPANLAAVRRDAGQVAAKARLIARTEPMNAEQEAHIRAAIDSPVVRAIRWQLSHRHKITDQCDVLAQVDWYGLGPGHYDPRRVPPRPHPRCLCVMRNVLRNVADWGKERSMVPDRRQDVDEIGELYELYPSQVAVLAAVLDVGEGRILRIAA